MSGRGLRPLNVTAGAVLVGGLLIIAFPRHAMSVLRLVIVTGAVAAALYALAVHVPQTGWISPFKWMSPFNRRETRRRRRGRVGELDVIRSSMAGRRQPIAGAPALPPAVLRLLQPMITVALDLDLRDRRSTAAARDRVGATTWAVLESEPLQRSSWLRTVRTDERLVVEAVHEVLDDLRFPAGSGPSSDSFKRASTS